MTPCWRSRGLWTISIETTSARERSPSNESPRRRLNLDALVGFKCVSTVARRLLRLRRSARIKFAREAPVRSGKDVDSRRANQGAVEYRFLRDIDRNRTQKWREVSYYYRDKSTRNWLPDLGSNQGPAD